jgi:hypothetical protein
MSRVGDWGGGGGRICEDEARNDTVAESATARAVRGEDDATAHCPLLEGALRPCICVRACVIRASGDPDPAL